MTTRLEHVELLFTVVERPFHLLWESVKISADCRTWLVQELRTAQYSVDVEDELVHVGVDARRVCSFGFRSVAEIAIEHHDDAWFRDSPVCPWVGRVLGYVEWCVERTAEPRPRESDVRRIIETLAGLGLGSVIDVLLGEEVHQPLVPVLVPLSHCLWTRHGFRTAMISYDDDYLHLVAGQINKRLREIGIGSRVASALGDHLLMSKYTPFTFYSIAELEEIERERRCVEGAWGWVKRKLREPVERYLDIAQLHGPIVDLRGRSIRNPDAILSKEHVELWTYDTQLTRKIPSIGVLASPLALEPSR